MRNVGFRIRISEGIAGSNAEFSKLGSNLESRMMSRCGMVYMIVSWIN